MSENEIKLLKKKSKVIGYILLFAEIIAMLFMGLKIKICICILALLVTYGMYVRYYPYLYVLRRTGTGKEKTVQLPSVNAANVAMAIYSLYVCMKLFNFDFRNLLVTTSLIWIFLTIPYLIKVVKSGERGRIKRKIAVICMTFAISSVIAVPLNYLITFDEPKTETVWITDKVESHSPQLGYDCRLFGNFHGEETSFNTVISLYEKTDIGDTRTVYIYRSVLGFEYNIIME